MKKFFVASGLRQADMDRRFWQCLVSTLVLSHGTFWIMYFICRLGIRESLPRPSFWGVAALMFQFLLVIAPFASAYAVVRWWLEWFAFNHRHANRAAWGIVLLSIGQLFIRAFGRDESGVIMGLGVCLVGFWIFVRNFTEGPQQ